MLDVSRARLVTFWALVDDLLNTLLFVLMGFEILAIDGARAALVPMLVAIPLALAARLVSVCALVPLLPHGLIEKGRAIAALTWLGLRGEISIALVLTLPQTPDRASLSAVCYGVVIFTIVVQDCSRLAFSTCSTRASPGKRFCRARREWRRPRRAT